MRVTFVSGWAGLPCLYPHIARQVDFLVPFFSHSPAQIEQALATECELLIGWSTGAHLILKQLELAGRTAGQIILIAPFLDFSSCVASRIVSRMRQRLLREAQATVEDFWARCGNSRQTCPPLKTEQIENLARGLDFLNTSTAKPEAGTASRLTLVRCRDDQLIPEAAFQAIRAALGHAAVSTVAAAHLPTEPQLARIIADVSSSALF